MPNPITHWEIIGENPEKLREFYGDLFGWHITPAELNYAMVDTQSGHGIRGGIGGTMGGPRRVTVYAEVSDLQATLDKAEQLGGKTTMPPTEIPGDVTIAMFTDPEGNLMGILKA